MKGFQLTLLLASAVAALGEEDSSRLQVTIPHDLFKQGGYEHREALFGIPAYGAKISEVLYYANSTLCDDDYDINGGWPSGGWQPPYILMIDRGTCHFVDKVRRAQTAGASGVIIADNTCLCSDEATGACSSDQTCEPIRPYMADDGSGGDITIPSFLMWKTDADAVKQVLMDKRLVQVEMTWSLPAPDDRVEWSLWTSSIDDTGHNIKNLNSDLMVQALGEHQEFTPWYYLFDGNYWGCVNSDACGNQCTNNGRYCNNDPDGDMEQGLSGADVVVENLRQICIWDLYGGADSDSPGVGTEWWKYVVYMGDHCNAAVDFKDAACIAKAMKDAGINAEKVDACMTASGGTSADGDNALLAKELEERTAHSIIILPSVYVNNVPERGTITTTAVMQTICSGYLPGTDPEACACASNTGTALTDCLNSGIDGDGFNNGTKGIGGFSTGTLVIVSLSIILAMSAVGVAYYRHTRAAMRDQVRSILAEYMPLEDMGDALDGNSGNGMAHSGMTSSSGYARQADMTGSIQGV